MRSKSQNPLLPPNPPPPSPPPPTPTPLRDTTDAENTVTSAENPEFLNVCLCLCLFVSVCLPACLSVCVCVSLTVSVFFCLCLSVSASLSLSLLLRLGLEYSFACFACDQEFSVPNLCQILSIVILHGHVSLG